MEIERREKGVRVSEERFFGEEKHNVQAEAVIWRVMQRRRNGDA